MPVDQLQATLGAAAAQWLEQAAASLGEPGQAPAARLADGRGLALAWRRLDADHAAVHLSADAEPLAGRAAPQLGSSALGAAGLRETVEFLWQSPFPAVLQGADFRIVDANHAFVDFIGHPREHLT